MKLARQGFSSNPYKCQKDWPDDCFVQCGSDGLVLKGKAEEVLGSKGLNEVVKNIKKQFAYKTAFFEAFLTQPQTFIRGEGSTIEEAEEKAWEKYTRYILCEHPEYEKRGYRNGVGFCVQCGMFKSYAFEPWESCRVCGELTYFKADDDGTVICKKDFYQLPYNEATCFYTEEEWELKKRR